MRETPSHYYTALPFLSIFFLTLLSQNIYADTKIDNLSSNIDLSLCQTKDNSATKHTKPTIFSADNINNTEISADHTSSSEEGAISLDGNVVIEKHLLRVSADHAHYDKQQEELEVSGNVHIDTERLSLDADSGTVNMNTTGGDDETKGHFKNIRFFIPDSNMKGKAEIINTSNRIDKNQTSVLNDASITTCDLFDPDWFISAKVITLDHEEEYGSAEDMVIRFKDIPFMYVPYMEFPTSNKRRSGFLFPELSGKSVV